MHSRSTRGLLCSKFSLRCDTRFGGTTWRVKCLCNASETPISMSPASRAAVWVRSRCSDIAKAGFLAAKGFKGRLGRATKSTRKLGKPGYLKREKSVDFPDGVDRVGKTHAVVYHFETPGWRSCPRCCDDVSLRQCSSTGSTTVLINPGSWIHETVDCRSRHEGDSRIKSTVSTTSSFGVVATKGNGCSGRHDDANNSQFGRTSLHTSFVRPGIGGPANR